MKHNYNSGLSWNFHTIAHRSIEWHLFFRCCCSGLMLKYGGFFLSFEWYWLSNEPNNTNTPQTTDHCRYKKETFWVFFEEWWWKKPQSNNMKAMKVLMAIADDNRIKFSMVMQSVPEIGFRLEKLNSICYRLSKSLTTRCTFFVFCVCAFSLSLLTYRNQCFLIFLLMSWMVLVILFLSHFFSSLFSSDIFVYNHHHSVKIKTLQVNGNGEINGENLDEFDINQYCSHIWFSLLGILVCSLQWMVLTKWPNLEQCFCKMSYDFCARFTIIHCKLDEPTII